MRYVYSLIRFVPDVVLGEFILLGAVVGSDESMEWRVRRVANARRARYIDVHHTLSGAWEFVTELERLCDL